MVIIYVLTNKLLVIQCSTYPLMMCRIDDSRHGGALIKFVPDSLPEIR